MLVVRILGILTAITIFTGVTTFFLTRDERYLRFSWRLFCCAIFVGLGIFALLILERAAIIVL